MEDFTWPKNLPRWLLAAGAVLLVISGFVWWRMVYQSPYNVWWGMLSSSLATSSVTKQTVQTGGGSTLNQSITLNFGPHDLAYGRTTLRDSTSTVTTETVGTLKSNYVRYTDIQSTEKNAQGKPLNFQPVLGKWARANMTAANGQPTSTPFFTQVLLGFGGGNLVPMANVPPAARQNLLHELRQSLVFNTSFNTVKHQLQHGRPVYTYKVTVEPVAYIAFERDFAAALGITSLQNVDPNSYQGQPATPVEISIDAWSHHLVAINYPGTNHRETYTSYGVPANVVVPKATISSAKLQTLLTGVQ